MSSDNHDIAGDITHPASTQTPYLHPSPAARLSPNFLIPKYASVQSLAVLCTPLPTILAYVFDLPMLTPAVLTLLSFMYLILSLKNVILQIFYCFCCWWWFFFFIFLLYLPVILHVRSMFLLIIFKFLCKSASSMSFCLFFLSYSAPKQNKTGAF